MNPNGGVAEEVCQIIGGAIGEEDAGAVAPAMSLHQHLGIDSLGLVTIVYMLEEDLGIDLLPYSERLVKVQRVTDLIEIIEEAKTRS